MSTSKTKVICDTNVWYAFTVHGYDKFSQYLNGVQLCMTSMTFYELLSSNNNKKNFIQFQNILKVISSSSVHFLAEDDILHILLLMSVDVYSKEVQLSKDVFDDFYNKIVSAKSISDVPYDVNKIVRKRRLYSTCLAFMERVYTRIWAYRGVNYDYVRNTVKSRLKNEMAKYIKRHKLQIDGHLKKEDLEKKFEQVAGLYLDCYSHFLYEVVKSYSKSSHIKIADNDIIDFRNLIYCGECEKYLTLEKNTSLKIGGMLHRYGIQHEIDKIDEIRQTAQNLYRNNATTTQHNI